MTEEERREWMEKQKAEGRFLFVEFLWLGLQKKAKLVEAMTTGQRVAIDIHYQDQMNTKVAFDLTLYEIIAVTKPAFGIGIARGKNQYRADTDKKYHYYHEGSVYLPEFPDDI